MIVLGLTGSIATGKTWAASRFRRLGVPVFDADRASRRLTGPGGAAAGAVAAAFPEALRGGRIDRDRLARIVFADAGALARLEAIVHPLVAAERRAWLRRQALRRAPVVVLDVPLLFETGGERRCDAVVVVSAPPFLQRQRALRRPGMDEARLAAALARQLPDHAKRRRADFVVPTGLGPRFALTRLRRVLRRMGGNRGETADGGSFTGYCARARGGAYERGAAGEPVR